MCSEVVLASSSSNLGKFLATNVPEKLTENLHPIA
jgi:hypothetical protein